MNYFYTGHAEPYQWSPVWQNVSIVYEEFTYFCDVAMISSPVIHFPPMQLFFFLQSFWTTTNTTEKNIPWKAVEEAIFSFFFLTLPRRVTCHALSHFPPTSLCPAVSSSSYKTQFIGPLQRLSSSIEAIGIPLFQADMAPNTYSSQNM